ncbi:AfsA-related hotdog domain-containing protein [Frankia sp. AgKG'84/4]|uniref:AfsA-related hotdog domain-containing protein n=1 Tax=Frankia sp. AgKG'84/4 TaxID=573490 RepID=UPI00200C8E4F|nr:AfsA-related hotdog domain-containing protein [Frankia sp. AgKG'84/4]MCL9792914.1 hypothetical protein [Frankia sp. AgKG'84/4]
MPAAIEIAYPENDPRELHFMRTVDRSLIHRHALSEVFLTDTVPTGAASYRAAAQLPSSHAYFTDHVRHGAVDPLLLLECSRQAETYGAHVHFGVTRETRFVLRSWSMRLPGLFASRPRGPAELTMAVGTRPLIGDRPTSRSLAYDIELSLDGGAIGDTHIEVGYLPDSAYEHLRALRRGSPPQTSDDLRSTPTTIAPAAVGRASRVNTILVDPVQSGDDATATIRVPVDNRSMFDHALDHFPGMVLTEAARQLCLWSGASLLGLPATAATVIAFDLAFTRFAELDVTTTVAAVLQHEEPVDTHTFAVSFWQNDAVIAAGTMTTCPVPASHRTDA